MDVHSDQKLLSISIPTYNRAHYLDLCLSQICKQLSGNEQFIELIVSDNASSDNTAEIVKKYRDRGIDLRYIRNKSNIGMDGNIVQAYTLATSKYVLVFSDDDAFVDGAINKLVDILQTGDYGVIFVSGYPYQDTSSWSQMPKVNSKRYFIYSDKKQFVERVNFHFTYVSGNIINKQMVDRDLNPSDFIGTYVALLSWTFSALFNSRQNVYIEEYLIAAKASNSGGYPFCKVFGQNVNTVFDFFKRKGIDKSYFDIINRKLLFYYFPSFIRNSRKGRQLGSYITEDYYETLRPIFRGYLAFWLFTVPAIKLPLPLLRLWFLVMRQLRKMSELSTKINDRFITHGFRKGITSNPVSNVSP